ncbi:MAG: c-type cytochrome [Myxococcales bacterium]|nr:c-type cytochrome [Myxococcales bacterium]
MSDLMSTVFVDRMRGVPQSEKRVEALTSWLRETPTVGASDTLDADAVARGKSLFESDKTQCATCHSGDNLTDNTTVDVGTGEALQVPSLVNVRNRAPFMHDGCAQTLYDRFDPKCGGSKHGEIASLSEDEVDDLVAYMLSL